MWVIECIHPHTAMADEFPTKHVWQPVRGTLSEGLPHLKLNSQNPAQPPHGGLAQSAWT